MPNDPNVEHRVFFGNLHYSIDDVILESLVQPIALPRQVFVVRDRMSGRSKGFGYAVLDSASDADKVIRRLHNALHSGSGEVWLQCADLPLASEDRAEPSPIVQLTERLSDGLARAIATNPSLLSLVEWRDLERTLAEVLKRIGFSVRLTPSSKDGGKDLVIEVSDQGCLKTYYIELKHWVSGKRVGAATLQQFLSVLVREEIDAGILLSTSGFAANACEGIVSFGRPVLHLGDGGTVISLCQTYVNVVEGVWVAQGSSELLNAALVPAGEWRAARVEPRQRDRRPPPRGVLFAGTRTLRTPEKGRPTPPADVEVRPMIVNLARPQINFARPPI